MQQPRLSFLHAAMMTCVTAFTASSHAATIDDQWRVLPGNDPLEATVAGDFVNELRHERHVSVQLVEQATDAPRLIVIGTLETSPLIRAENAREPFNLDTSSPEAFAVSARNDRLYVVGVTPKGAMNGAFRVLDRGTLDLSELNFAGTPRFRYRVAGHKMNQAPPPDWSDVDQARYYARHYINVVWGEKKPPPMSYESRKKYGLGLMAELRFPSAATDDWWNDPANAEAIYYSKPESKRRVISPFAPAGHKWYLDGYKQLFAENPDLVIPYAIFGDYNAIPTDQSVRASDNQPLGHSREETMIAILDIIREAAKDHPGVTPRAWLWHAFYGWRAEELAFMDKLDGMGYGLFYNEAGNNDDWVIKLDNFDDAALKTTAPGKPLFGDNYVSLVSAGGACESTNPVIAMPLPRVAAYKLGRLAKAGVRDVALWWGSGEGWAYQPNLEVIADLTWDADAGRYGDESWDAVAPLLHRIAARDFGVDLADDVVAYWQAFDAALVDHSPLYRGATEDVQGDPTTGGLRIYSWWQRMGIYTEMGFGAAYPEPITPITMTNRDRFKQLQGWGEKPYVVVNYAAVLEHLKGAEDQLQTIADRASNGPAKDRLQSMLRWSKLYRLLLTSQSLHIRGLQLANELRDKRIDPDSDEARDAFEPLTHEAIDHAEVLLDHVEHSGFAANFNIIEPQEGVVQDEGSIAKEARQIRSMIAMMKQWLSGGVNLAKGHPTVASSVDPGKNDRDAARATDGDTSTLWASDFKDSQWIYVDLGAPCEISSIVLQWKTAYAKWYKVEVATDAPDNWQTIYETEQGADGLARIDLPEPVSGRYLRVFGIERGSPYGFALREIEVYGRQQGQASAP